MTNTCKKNRKAFSLVEMIVTAVLLSAAVVTICAITNRSLSGVKSNRQHEFAWELLDRQLTLIDAVGVEEFVELGQMQGQFQTDTQFGTTYYWQVQTEQALADNLYDISMIVYWGPENRRQSVSVSTAINAAPATATSETVETEG